MDDKEFFKRLLLSKRQIFIFGEIDAGLQEYITQSIIALNASSKEEILLLIDSTGGSTKLSFYMYDAIKQSEATVRAIVVGEASSAAFLVLQACHKRLAYPHARVLFHSGTVSGIKSVDEELCQDTLETSRRNNAETIDIIQKRSGRAKDEIERWFKAEKYFSAREAKELGFIDEIIEPA